MRLSKNEIPAPVPYPLQPASGGQEALAGLLGKRNGTRHDATTSDPANFRATADLLDLVSDHRRDLMQTLLEALNNSESTREHAEQLMELVAACGLAEATSPCATAMAISVDLERLANTSSRWTHPAQVVKNPDAQALHKLCTARIEHETGPARERLEKIQPRLERTARLTKKAASRRNQSAARQPKWVESWL